jgi:hypothetical protein
LRGFDLIGQVVDVVRVSLAAVQFIVSLEVRENLANPRNEMPLGPGLFHDGPKGFEGGREVWAEKHGVLSALVEEDFSALEPVPYWHRFRRMTFSCICKARL